MNKKITLQDITDKVSEQTGLTKKVSDDFLREFINIIEEALNKDSIAKIKGLGTFKLLLVEERKSVNVQTGNEMIIPEHYKIAFTPEKGLKMAVNKPFAHLETYILSKDGPIDPPANEDEDEEIEPEKTEFKIEEKSSDSFISGKKRSQSEYYFDDEPDIIIEEDSQTVTTPPVFQISESEIETKHKTIKKDEQSIESSSIQENNTSTQNKNNQKTSNIQKETGQEKEILSEKEQIPEKNINTLTQEKIQINKNENSSEIAIQEKPDQPAKKQKKIWNSIVIILVIFGLIACGLTWFSDSIFAPPASQQKEKIQVEPENKPNQTEYESSEEDMTNEEHSTQPEIQDSESQLHEGFPNEYKFDKKFDYQLIDYMQANYPNMSLETWGTPEKVEITNGQRLTTIALKHYGNRHFWVYLYYYNTNIINNPNNVSVGLIIDVPTLDKSLADPKNSEHIDIAIEIKNELLKLK